MVILLGHDRLALPNNLLSPGIDIEFSWIHYRTFGYSLSPSIAICKLAWIIHHNRISTQFLHPFMKPIKSTIYQWLIIVYPFSSSVATTIFIGVSIPLQLQPKMAAVLSIFAVAPINTLRFKTDPCAFFSCLSNIAPDPVCNWPKHWRTCF